MKIKRILALVVAVSALMSVLQACGDKEGSGEKTTVASKVEKIPLEILSREPEGEMILLRTNYAEMRYSYAFFDLIDVEVKNGGIYSSLTFYLTIEDYRYMLYRLNFGPGKGVDIGTLDLRGASQPVKVWAEVARAPADLPQELKTTFFAAQETFNEVANSLANNPNFQPAGE